MEYEFIKSSEDLLEEFCVFIETSIHLILFTRRLYPRDLFESKAEFGLSVKYCRHPLVIDFVKKAVESFKPLLRLNALEKIFLAVFDKQRVPVEQFVLSFKWMMEFPLVKKPILVPRFELERLFREFLFKIAVADELLSPMPNNASFDLVVRLCKKIKLDSSMRFIKYDTPWKEAANRDFEGSTLTPLNDLTTNLLRLQLYVEEKNKEPAVPP